MKFTNERTKEEVNLTKDFYRAEGGEGTIYIKDNRVYKVCRPETMIPRSKFAELAVLQHNRIVRPKDIWLNAKGQALCYDMDLVPGNAVPLAQILTKAYREREGVTPDHMLNLVKQIDVGIRYIHSKKILQVDGNEFNYMVTSDYKDVYFIDVNSYQTPSHPALAIMPSIQDHTIPSDPSTGFPQWSELSDWYSFAIISFTMFTAIHPYRGNHDKVPKLNNNRLIDMMMAGVSVLDPEVKFPKGAAYMPFEDVIPGGGSGAYMQWYKAIFVDRRRLPAPKDFQDKIAFAAKIKEIIGSNNFDMEKITDYDSMVVGYYYQNGMEVVTTREKIYSGPVPHDVPKGRYRIGFELQRHIPVVMWLDGDNVRLKEINTDKPIAIDDKAKDIMSHDGRLYIQSEANISEVHLFNGKAVTTPLIPSSAATQLFQGVAINQVFGAYMAIVFPASGVHSVIPLKELKDHKIVAAKYEEYVLMVSAMEKETGMYHRFVFRFDKDHSAYDVRKVENVVPMGLNFTVRKNGVVVCITEEEKVEIFLNTKGSPDVKAIDDPSVTNDMRLCHKDQTILFARGNNLYRFAVKKSS